MEYIHMEKSEAIHPADDEKGGDQPQKVADRSADTDQSNTESDSSREGAHDSRVDNGSKVTQKEKDKDMAQEKLEDLSDSEMLDLEAYLSKQKANDVGKKHDFSSDSESDNKAKKAVDASRVNKDTDESNTSDRSNTDNDTSRSDDKSSLQQTPPTSPPQMKEHKFYPSTSSDSDSEGGSPSRTQQPKPSESSSDSSSGKGKKTKQGSSSDSSGSDRRKKTKQGNKSDSSSSDRGKKGKASSTSSSDSDTRNKKARNAMLIKQHRVASPRDSDTDSQTDRSKQEAQQKSSDTDSQPDTAKQAAVQRSGSVAPDSDTDSQTDTPKQAEQQKRDDVTPSSGSDTETEQRVQRTEEKHDKKSSSDSSSDTETETDKKAKPDDKKETWSVSGSESSDDSMSGGYDRDGVAGREEPSVPRVQTPTRVQPGSIRHLVEGKHEIVINNLALTKMQMSEMADILEDNRQIDALYLRNCDLDDDAVKKLAEALTATPDTDLKVLNLNCNKLSPASVQHILKIVRRKRNLEMLLLHGNTLGDAGAEDLCQGLIDIHKQRQDQLTTKAEEMQAIRSTAQSVVSDVMSDVMKSDSLDSLKVPDSGPSSEQSDGSMAELVGSVEKDSPPKLSIQHLDLGDCGLKRAGAEAVAKLISANIGISNLCLTGNRDINTRGWKAIAEALKTNTDIEVLSLDHNKLENKATSTLADCLKENDSLINLDLEGNNIGNRGGKKILEMVKINSKVKDITLTPGNSISKDILADVEKTLALRRRGK